MNPRTASDEQLTIGRYEPRLAACHVHDPRAAEVASAVGALIEARLPEVSVEHVGSTAVAGCDGKGIVDLALVYPPGMLNRARGSLDELGFQRQEGRDPFPEERPMRVGAVTVDGACFLLHVHVISADSVDADELRRFRDRLRNEPAIRTAYVDLKRAILAAGVIDSFDYTTRKSDFIRAQLDPPPAPPRPPVGSRPAN